MHWIQDLQDGVAGLGKVNYSQCHLCSKMETEKLGVVCVKPYMCIYIKLYICVYDIYCFFLFLGDSFSQFRFAEEKEWDGETSCPKQVRQMCLECRLSLLKAKALHLPIIADMNPVEKSSHPYTFCSGYQPS